MLYGGLWWESNGRVTQPEEGTETAAIIIYSVDLVWLYMTLIKLNLEKGLKVHYSKLAFSRWRNEDTYCV